MSSNTHHSGNLPEIYGIFKSNNPDFNVFIILPKLQALGFAIISEDRLMTILKNSMTGEALACGINKSGCFFGVRYAKDHIARKKNA